MNPGSGQARFSAENLALPDFHDFVNAVSPSPSSVPGHVSFDVRWQGGGDRSKVVDAVFGFAGEYVTGPATIEFTVSDDGGESITSDAGGQANGGPPGVGHERNGRFLPAGEANAAAAAASGAQHASQQASQRPTAAPPVPPDRRSNPGRH